MFGVLFLTAVSALAFLGRLPRFIALGYIILSTLTFAVYARDKAAARRGEWRTRESVLHGLALIGGWPGALAARSWLRHKSKKRSFGIALWSTVAANGLVLGAWLYYLDGGIALPA